MREEGGNKRGMKGERKGKKREEKKKKSLLGQRKWGYGENVKQLALALTCSIAGERRAGRAGVGFLVASAPPRP